MLLTLFYFTVVFLIINFLIVDKDYFHPTIIFISTFLIAELLCLSNQKTFDIEFSFFTFIVFYLVFLTFTIVNILGKYTIRNRSTSVNSVRYINIDKLILITFLIIEIVFTLFFFVYEKRIYSAYVGGSGSFSEIINNYDRLTKFFIDDFIDLQVPRPLLYKLLAPFINPLSYVIIYILVNNYVVTKKINIYMLLSTLLFMFQKLMTGSRGPLFKIITFMVVVFYILKLRQSGMKKLDSKFFSKIVLGVILLAPLFVLFLNATGRRGGIGDDPFLYTINKEVFKYIGAPLLNLNNYIMSHSNFGQQATLFGEQTFRGFYQYLYSLFEIKKFDYDSIVSVHSYVFSRNGIQTGNVFTAFYMFVYDFGIYGIVPLSLILSGYFNISYLKLKYKKRNSELYKFDFRLYIFAYLFNDLIMEFFSNRFFETVVNESFIPFVIISLLIFIILNKNYVFRIKDD